MNIYFLKYSENENDFVRFLSEQRKNAVDNINNPAVKREKIYSYALLCHALFKDYGITAPPVFSYGERGKPFLSDNPDLFFSLSHAGGCTACVTADFPIGLDIQDNRPLKADISEKICTENELKRLDASTDRNSEICRLWCIKESVGKLTGMGFAEGFTGIETEKLIQNGKTFSVCYDNFFISVSANEILPETSIIGVSEKEITDLLLSFYPNQHNFQSH